MSNTQLTSRQKMINLIYLVLTAILALNVSAEVLDAFKNVNDGIKLSNNSLQSKNTDTYSNLGRQFQNDSLKAKAAYEKARQARQVSSALYAQLDQYKMQMIKEAGGIDTITGKIKHDDDVDIATRLFVEEGGKNGIGLKSQIEKARTGLLQLLDGNDRNEVEKSLALRIDEPANGKTWEYAKFNQVPVVAAVTLLTKYQNDLLSAEGHVIETLYNSINRSLKNVDRMQAKIISPSNFILQGESYKADVMVAAYSSTQNPDVFIGQFNAGIKKDGQGNYLPLISTSDAPPLSNPAKVEVADGFGKIQMTGVNAGNKKYSGVVRVKAQDGRYEFYPFEGEYQVAPKVAVVSPKMMNVLYIGLDNPMDISVQGVPQSDVSAAFDNDGVLVKNPDGSYTAKVFKTGTRKVFVKAKVEGRQIEMGEQQFRIKRIPDPATTVDGIYEGGKITKAKMKSTRGIVAVLKNFDYNARFTVESYEIRYKSKKDGNTVLISNAGPAYNKAMNDILDKRLSPGDGVFIDEIIVKGPAGDNRKINPIAFDIVQ